MVRSRLINTCAIGATCRHVSAPLICFSVLSLKTVVQFHPPESTYVSNHPYTLHLWRDTRHETRMPPPILVGVKAAGDLTGRMDEVARLARLRDAGRLT